MCIDEDMYMENIKSLLYALEENCSNTGLIRCCIGFDGFIDKIFRVVESRKTLKDFIFFQTIKDFAECIKASSRKSADKEIVLQEVRFGGNAPIMANAIASQGFKTKCIGAFGIPEVYKIFKDISGNCTSMSIAEPGHTYAFEFDDGKIMFGNIANLHNIDWSKIDEHIGIKNLLKIYSESDLIGIVNWSGINNMNSILRSILNEVFSQIDLACLKNKYIFFDIADPSSKSREDILEFLKIINEFSKYSKVILGLNEKEARLIYKALGKNGDSDFLRDVGQNIFNETNIASLVIHALDHAVGITKDEIKDVKGIYVDKPKLTTGGGDNFNCGFCTGQLLGCSLEQSLILGSATGAFYVSNGYSPSSGEIVDYLKEIIYGKL